MADRILALVLVACVAGSGPAWAADSYSTSIVLSDGQPGAGAELTFTFRASDDEVEKVGNIEIGLAEGATINAQAFRRTCSPDGTGPKAAVVCADQYRDARVGEGTMTVEMLGMHTVKADAYRIETTAEGANLVFYFPSGQVFGVGAQSILGSVTLDGSTPGHFRIFDIQKQLDLPFGATAELEKGSFTFSGEPGTPAITNPKKGTTLEWLFETKLAWEGGTQSQRVHASASK